MLYIKSKTMHHDDRLRQFWVYEAQIINKSDYLGVLSSASDGKSAEFGCKYIKNTTLIM